MSEIIMINCSCITYGPIISGRLQWCVLTLYHNFIAVSSMTMALLAVVRRKKGSACLHHAATVGNVEKDSRPSFVTARRDCLEKIVPRVSRLSPYIRIHFSNREYFF